MAFFDDNYEIPGGPVAMDTINSQLPPAPRVPAPAPAPPPVQFPEMPPSQPPPMLARPEEPPPSAPPLPVVRPPGAGGVGPSAPRSGPSFDAQQTALNKSAMKGAEFEAKQQGLKSDAQMFQANEHAKALGQSQNEQKALEAAYVPERKRLDAIQAAEEEKYRKMEPRDFWSTKSTGDKVMAALAVALGGLGDAFTAKAGGKSNYADRSIGIINAAIEQDAQLQRDMREKQKDTANRAGADLTKLDARHGLDEMAIETRKKNAWEMVDATTQKMLAAAGKPPEDIALNPIVIKAQQEALAAQQRLETFKDEHALRRAQTVATYANAEHDRAAARAAGAAGGKLTESQGKAADLAGRMLEDNQTLTNMPPMSAEGLKRLRELAAKEELYGPKVVAAFKAKGKWPTPEEVLANDNDRAVYGARTRFASSVLRGDSGAAIAMSEYLNFDRQNFEQLGDKPQDIELKRHARQRQVEGKLIAAGPGAALIRPPGAGPTPQAAPAQAGGPPAGARRVIYKGTPGYLTADDEFHADSQVASR
jgi:hypothetical protein